MVAEAVSRPVTVSTALPTKAGTLAACSGALAAWPSGPVNVAKRTSKARCTSEAAPVTATYCEVTAVMRKPAEVSQRRTAETSAPVGPKRRCT
jgi:hypothetical protein